MQVTEDTYSSWQRATNVCVDVSLDHRATCEAGLFSWISKKPYDRSACCDNGLQVNGPCLPLWFSSKHNKYLPIPLYWMIVFRVNVHVADSYYGIRSHSRLCPGVLFLQHNSAKRKIAISCRFNNEDDGIHTWLWLIHLWCPASIWVYGDFFAQVLELYNTAFFGFDDPATVVIPALEPVRTSTHVLRSTSSSSKSTFYVIQIF